MENMKSKLEHSKERVVKRMKDGKPPVPSVVSSKMLKLARNTCIRKLTRIFKSLCLKGKLQENGKIVLAYH